MTLVIFAKFLKIFRMSSSGQVAKNEVAMVEIALHTYVPTQLSHLTGGSRGTSLSSVELPRIILTKYPRLRIDT